MEMFKDFLLHVSFILFPIFLYHALWLSRTLLISQKRINCSSQYSHPSLQHYVLCIQLVRF